VRVWRLEFEQPDGRWTGPYCAEWMTERAFEIRRELILAHLEGDVDRPWPADRIFTANPGPDRYVCATLTESGLRKWFGRWFDPLMDEGGYIGSYDVPATVPVIMDGRQVIYMQRLAQLHGRFGYPTDRLRLVQRIHPTKTARHLEGELDL
jgi:hypothetical protein